MSVRAAVILSNSADSFRMQSHQQIISSTCQVGKLADVGVMCHTYIYILLYIIITIYYIIYNNILYILYYLLYNYILYIL